MAAARVIHGAMGRMIHSPMVHHVVMHVCWTRRRRRRRLFRLLRQITRGVEHGMEEIHRIRQVTLGDVVHFVVE